MPAQVPGTVASALQALGQWDHQHPADLDGQDWWYRTNFPVIVNSTEAASLCFDGLATLAEVYLNGALILTSNNMFRRYRVDVSKTLLPENELQIVFRALTADQKQKRPRPRWKTNLVNHQQLRWQRTSLLGRIPGWTPPVPAVGPWRDIRLELAPVLLENVRCRSIISVDGKVTGPASRHSNPAQPDAGLLTSPSTDFIVSFHADVLASVEISAARMHVGSHAASLTFTNGELHGELRVSSPERWWPHTHGTPHLYDCRIVIETPQGSQTFPQERIGFREISLDAHSSFAVRVNGEPIYCRGACWTASDIFTLTATEADLRRDLTLARDAGMNMLRIGGTMIYESDAFYRLCDELGILVWQDFMFANMDYPVGDAAFSENIRLEAVQQLDRLAQHACVAVYCGNSEIEQQAAMLGMPRELWRNDWFGETLPALCQERHPGTIYVPSSPSGGVLPFHTRTGVTHYYGIGAYLRSLRELRQADVKFTSECLGFANIPEPEIIDEFMVGLMPVVHHPRWKQRVPRDTGSAWDFEDVRDHYLQELFNVDPAKIRSFDMPRYLELSRVTSGEMMARTFAEWRSSYSNNAGALVWFFKDLWAATGWGIVDHHGRPKAAYYQLKRSWQTRQLTITDEGLDGLHVHLINETNAPIEGFLELQLLREPSLVVATHELPAHVSQRAILTRSMDEIIGTFHDINYAYRFGPQVHHVVIATWFDSAHNVISQSVHLNRARDPEPQDNAADSLVSQSSPLGEGRFLVTLTSDRLLHGVQLSAPGFLPDDNYFPLAPARQKSITFAPLGGHGTSFRASIAALNLMGEISVAAKASAS